MTVADQVRQTVAGLKSAQASLETFALQTQNQKAKQMFQQAAQQTQMIVNKSVKDYRKSNKKNRNTDK